MVPISAPLSLSLTGAASFCTLTGEKSMARVKRFEDRHSLCEISPFYRQSSRSENKTQFSRQQFNASWFTNHDETRKLHTMLVLRATSTDPELFNTKFHNSNTTTSATTSSTIYTEVIR